MFSSTMQSKNYDKYSPSAIRADMMTLQQQIHRIHSQYDQISQVIPPDLPNNLQPLMMQMKILSKQVNAEMQFKYANEITSLEKKINELNQKLTEHETEAKNQKNLYGDYNNNSLSELEKKITSSNNLFLDKVHTKIKQRLENLQQKNNNADSKEQKTIDLHLSANFPLNLKTEAEESNEKNSQIVQIETSSVLDPSIHLRVQRHSDRIQLVEDDFDRLLSQKFPEVLPQKKYRQLSSESEANKKQIDELEKKYSELESTLRDYKQEKQAMIEKKRKMKEAKKIQGAVTFSEFSDFTNKIFNQFNDLSIEISSAENEINNSIFELNEQLNSIDKKINDFKQSASDFESLIKLTDRKMIDVELKIHEKSEKLNLSDNQEDKLKVISENGEMKISQLSQQIKDEIDNVKKSIDELQNENKETSKIDNKVDDSNNNETNNENKNDADNETDDENKIKVNDSNNNDNKNETDTENTKDDENKIKVDDSNNNETDNENNKDDENKIKVDDSNDNKIDNENKIKVDDSNNETGILKTPPVNPPDI